MFNKSDDKNYLAMLALPVILSMALGFSLSDPASAQASTRSQSSTQSSGDYSYLRDNTIENEYTTEKMHRIRKSIENNNFSEFTQATRNTPFSGIITEDVFSELVSQYTLHTKGYRTTSPLDLE